MNSMEKQWFWYLAGAFDTNSTLSVNIRKNSMKLGYSIEPSVAFSRPKGADTVFGLIDEYAEEVSVRTTLTEVQETLRLELTGVEDTKRLLEPLVGGMVQQRERAEFMLDTLLPLFNETPIHDKEKFIEVMEAVDEMRELPIQQRSSKYDVDYFRDEWNLD